MAGRILTYSEKDTWIHRLSGVSKMIFFLLWSLTGMLTYDTRVLMVMLICSLVIFKVCHTGISLICSHSCGNAVNIISTAAEKTSHTAKDSGGIIHKDG